MQPARVLFIYHLLHLWWPNVFLVRMIKTCFDWIILNVVANIEVVIINEFISGWRRRNQIGNKCPQKGKHHVKKEMFFYINFLLEIISHMNAAQGI